LLTNLDKLKKHFDNLSPSFRNIIGNIGWLLGDKFIQIILGFVTISLLARHLGVQKYGTFSYALAFFGLLQPLSSVGLNTLVVREIVHYPNDKYKILGTTFNLQLLGGLLTLFLASVGIQLLRPDDHIIFNLIFILSLSNIVNAFQCIDLWFQSQVKARYTALSNNISYSSYFILTVILLFSNTTSLSLFAFSKFFNSVIKSSLLVYFYKKTNESIKLWTSSVILAKSFIRESYPLILSTFATTIYVKIDQIMIGQMLNDKVVGIYSVAAQISEIFYVIPVIILTSVSPAIYKAKKDLGEEVYYQRIKSLLRLLSLFAIIISISITLLSPALIFALFGQAFSDSGLILQIHTWASIFVFSGTGASCWFVAEHLTHLTFFRTLLGAILNILLNLYLIPKYEGVGAAIATIISYAFGSILANYFHTKTRKLFFLQINCLMGGFL
jgi:PST family polysaccharide transporter